MTDASQFVRQRLDDPNDQRQLPQQNPLSPENIAAAYAREKLANMQSYAMAPGDAMMGRMDPNSEEGFRRIQGLAMGVFNGGMPAMVGPVERDSVGMFVRPWDMERLAAARGMKERDQRVPSGDMWQATQTRQGGAGNYMQEVPDNMATVAAHNLPPSGAPTTLGEVLRHRQLYEVDPALREIPTQMSAPGQGRYDYNRGMLFVDPKQEPAAMRAQVLGDVQHAIQAREGWPEGGSAAERFQFDSNYGLMPEGFYERKAQQLEGNQLPQATMRRRNMTGAQRAERDPAKDMK